MTYKQFLLQEKVNAAVSILTAEQKLNYFEMIIEEKEEQAFEYLLQCVFDKAAAELKEQDIEAYNTLMSE